MLSFLRKIDVDLEGRLSTVVVACLLCFIAVKNVIERAAHIHLATVTRDAFQEKTVINRVFAGRLTGGNHASSGGWIGAGLPVFASSRPRARRFIDFFTYDPVPPTLHFAASIFLALPCSRPEQ